MTGKNYDYGALVASAEAAVKSVKDPELKRVAFQKILEDLLSSATNVKTGKDVRRQPRRRLNSRESRGGPRAYIKGMADDGFFKKPKTIAQVKAELENRGHHIPITSLSGPLQKLCQNKILRRQKTREEGNKQVFAYADW
jgi:hypothetical protein